MYQLHADVLESYAGKEATEFDPEKLYTSFRNLRNLCTTGKDIQTSLCQNELFNHTIIIIDKLIKSYHEPLLPPLKQGLQFVYNLSVDNDLNRHLLWTKYNAYLKNWMSFKKEDCVRNYVCGTLYNVALNSDYLLEILSDVSLLNLILDSAVMGIDYPILFIENIFRIDSSEQYLLKLFDCDDTFHIYLINLLLDYVKENEISRYYIDYIATRYQRKVEFALANGLRGVELQEIFLLLQILLQLSIKDDVLPVLQNIELLDTTKHLLEVIHIKGKDSQSEFAPTEDIFPERTDAENLKANLIRFIANLCWRNKLLQDRIRETEGLPIILDSCVRDGKNPFITETAVFAIRNLCEFNNENQSVIRNLNSEVHGEIVERMKSRASLFVPS